MDQLKQYWEIAKKQHFWILCGLAVLVPLIASMVANGHLAKIYTDQMSKIKGVDAGLDPLVNAPDHPNDVWVTHVHEETERLRGNVKEAWDALYKQQQTVLKWPQGLGADFIAAFNKPVAADDPRALEPLCERYQNYVKTELAHMADIVKAEWAPGDKAAARGGPRLGRPAPSGADSANAEEKKTYIVFWDPADQTRLVDAYDWQDPPTPLDVRYAQEELWVLEAICKSIDRTNVGATGDFDAVVREIDKTLIGYDATDRYPLGEGAGRIDRPHKSGPTALAGPLQAPLGMNVPGGAQSAFEPKRPMRHRTTDEGALGGRIRPPSGGTLAMMQGGAMPGPAGPVGSTDPDAWLKDGRYVDAKGKPMLGSDWPNSTTPEFNLMAFKLTIVADEQRWQKLLIELCNSPLPLEVREVRINPNDREGGGGPMRGRDVRPQEGQSNATHNVTLEIDGVAYLMNPPNLAKLGITAAGAPPAAAASALAVPAPTTVPSTAVLPTAVPPTAPGPTATATTPTGAPATTPATNAAPAGVPPSAAPATTPPTTPTPAGAPSTTPATTTPLPTTTPAPTAPATAPPPVSPPTTAPAASK